MDDRLRSNVRNLEEEKSFGALGALLLALIIIGIVGTPLVAELISPTPSHISSSDLVTR